MNALDYNYAALAVAILRGCSVEHAFELLENPEIRTPKFTDDDIEDMVKLKQEYTYKQIGEIYGLSRSAVYNRIRRYKNQRKQPQA